MNDLTCKDALGVATGCPGRTPSDCDVSDLDIGFNDVATFVKDLNEVLPYSVPIEGKDYQHLDSKSYSVVRVNNKSLREIVIPDYFDDGVHGRHPVTAIENEAFRDSVIEKVVLPLSITYVLKQAFDGCVRLTQINIPKRVEWIRGFCFDGCVSLTKIHLPISVAHIGVGAFDECRNLEIYTDHIDKQTGWANSWNKGNRPVFWAGQWKWVNGVPSQISDRKTN